MDCGICTSKTILLFLSLVFWGAGAALAYVGAYMINSYGNFESFIQNKQTMVPAAIVIGISVLMFIFGLVGCCATLKESKFGLGCFFLIIMVIFAAEVTALVFTFIYQGKINQDLEHSMNEVFEKYDGHNTESQAVDLLQRELKCCGVSDYRSWFNTTWFKNNSTIPPTCCKNQTNCEGHPQLPALLYPEGCKKKLQTFLQDVLTYAMLVVLGFAIIKFFGMLSICVVTCRSSSRRSGYQPLYA
ncbi:tetraspanin 36 [Girardinichthys multiradiatus]|uniref:tetraspanin 36 n=1 Tax=Girardinichthys multiradiatus TaxID=208333 RepID=UPI001FADC3A4|nr:tetraspanin 36 [Girardinichthys multiradiatus]